MPVTLELREAVPLAQAFTDEMARRHGIRALGIKGPLLDAQGLRSKRLSSDADVFVDPEHFNAFCMLLEAHGWVPRYSRSTPSILPQHSITYFHPQWPCDIDVHHTYPGAFSEPSQLFELLWNARTEIEIAGRPVVGLNRPANALIMALHGCRHPHSERHKREVQNLREIITGQFQSAEMTSFKELAVGTRSVHSIAPLVRELSIQLDDDLSKEEKARWDLYQRTNEDGSTSAWLLSLFTGPWYRVPRELFRAIYPSRSAIEHEHPDAANSFQKRLSFRLTRIRRGVGALPNAIFELRNYREHKNHVRRVTGSNE